MHLKQIIESRGKEVKEQEGTNLTLHKCKEYRAGVISVANNTDLEGRVGSWK